MSANSVSKRSSSDRYVGGNVYLGVKADLRAQYPKDREVTWFQFSSCTCDIQVEQSAQFCGSSGTRTLFSIELTTGRARSITKFSLVPSEAEVLLPPISRFKMLGQLDAGGGLVIIQMKELLPKDPIIDFDAAATSPASSPSAPVLSAASLVVLPAAGGDDSDDELQQLVCEMVQLKVGLKKACATFARSLALAGVMSLEDLRPLPTDEVRGLLEKAGMQKLQIVKVFAMYNNADKRLVDEEEHKGAAAAADAQAAAAKKAQDEAVATAHSATAQKPDGIILCISFNTHHALSDCYCSSSHPCLPPRRACRLWTLWCTRQASGKRVDAKTCSLLSLPLTPLSSTTDTFTLSRTFATPIAAIN
jgi:hypothetical protein